MRYECSSTSSAGCDVLQLTGTPTQTPTRSWELVQFQRVLPCGIPPRIEGLYGNLASASKIASTAKSWFGLGWKEEAFVFFLFSSLVSVPVCVEAEATIMIVLVCFVGGRYQ